MDNTVDVTPAVVEFEVDRLAVRIVVARREGGLKVAEEGLDLPCLLHPFAALDAEQRPALLAQACDQARAKWESERDA